MILFFLWPIVMISRGEEFYGPPMMINMFSLAARVHAGGGGAAPRALVLLANSWTRGGGGGGASALKCVAPLTNL